MKDMLFRETEIYRDLLADENIISQYHIAPLMKMLRLMTILDELRDVD